MTRIETRRFGQEQDGETRLLMLIGDSYLEWFEFFRLKEPKLLFYFFAYIFEQQYMTRGTDLHKHITKVLIGSEVEVNGEKATAMGAVLDYSLAMYETERHAKHSDDPEYISFGRL